MKSRSGCGLRQAADNAIRFCYSIGRERYLFELLSLTSSIIMINVCRQRLIKVDYMKKVRAGRFFNGIIGYRKMD